MNFEQLNDLAVWRRMPTLDLDRIAAVRLMNRVDTKYLVDERRCMELLERARGAKRAMALADTKTKNRALSAMADALEEGIW